MADEINLQFVVNEAPEQALQSWRQDLPKPLEDGDYELVDEAYNALTYESRYVDWPMKITNVLSFGLMRTESIWRVTARFDPDGAGRTKVTLLGKVHPRTHAVLLELAERQGALPPPPTSP